jgi:hypothetical protein
MHDLCYDVYDILNIKCLECNKNILNNSDFKYINDNQLNEIINNYNNNFINKYKIHVNCINIKYLIKIIADNKINIITKNIFNKIKLLEYNIDEIFYSNCFLCNKKFRFNINKYTFESYMEYLENILILKTNNAYIFNHFNIYKKYAYLCNNCYYKISNHSFYNKFFFDNLNKKKLSEKQINILNNIKNFCIK